MCKHKDLIVRCPPFYDVSDLKTRCVHSVHRTMVRQKTIKYLKYACVYRDFHQPGPFIQMLCVCLQRLALDSFTQLTR